MTFIVIKRPKTDRSSRSPSFAHSLLAGMASRTEHSKPHMQELRQWASGSLPHTHDSDAWPGSRPSGPSMPVLHTGFENCAHSSLPALEPLMDAAYQASWRCSEPAAAFWATDHSIGLPFACCQEVDDVFEDLPLMLPEPATALDSCEPIADTSGRRCGQPPSIRSDEQGSLAVNPPGLALRDLHSEPPRPHPIPTGVDLLMQALEGSFTSSTNDDRPAPGGNDKTRKHLCPLLTCNKAFRQPAHLTTHMRSHTGEKPYQCHVLGCDAAFTQLGNLRTHEGRHRGEKPPRRSRPQSGSTAISPPKRYVCKLDGCAESGDGHGKAYSQLGNLKKHMDKFHSKTLARLRENLADQGRIISQEELELRKYLESLYRRCNRMATIS